MKLTNQVVTNVTLKKPTSPNQNLKIRYDLKVCDNGTLLHILGFLTLSIVLSLSKTSSCLSFKTERFGDWILSPSSRKAYSVGPNR
jgi:hypothetical protein